MVTGVAGAVLVTEQRRKNLDQRAQQVSNQVAQAEQSLKQLEAVESRRKQVIDKARTSAALIETIPQSLIIAMVTNKLPEGAALIDYQMKTRELQSQIILAKAQEKKIKPLAKKKAGAEEPPKPLGPPRIETTLELTGIAWSDMQVAEFVANLNRSPLLENVDLQYAKEHEQDGEQLRLFEVHAKLADDADNDPQFLAAISSQRQDNAGKRYAPVPLDFRQKQR